MRLLRLGLTQELLCPVEPIFCAGSVTRGGIIATGKAGAGAAFMTQTRASLVPTAGTPHPAGREFGGVEV